MIDIDWFKKINDQYGHPAGDRTLISFSESLKSVVSPKDLTGRIGGDEFTLFLADINQKSEIEDFLVMLKADWEERQKALEMHDKISVSAGITFASGGNVSYEALLNKADQALYLAKKNRDNELVHWELLLR